MSKPAVRNSQLLSLDQNCAKCLLEAYVERSISQNEEFRTNQLKQLKRVKRDNRASRDTSTHRLSVERLLSTSKCPRCTTSAVAFHTKSRSRPSRTKSFFKGFLNIFSKKKHEPLLSGEAASETGSKPPETEWKDECLIERSLSLTKERKNLFLKRGMLDNEIVEEKDTLQNDATFFFDSEEELSDMSDESSNKYLQRMSMELESIVNEIQFPPEDESASLPSAACVGDCSSAGDASAETAEKIIRLLKQHGDIIDKEISRNKSVQDFLQKLSYSSFQQMADRYVAQIPSPLPQTTDASPEVVRLAFTLDFTAKVATLCVQTFGLIMGFGHQYLQDSFTQMCSAHKEEPESSEGQSTCGPE